MTTAFHPNVKSIPSGTRFGRLVVQARTEKKRASSHEAWWLCLCDCGGTKSVSSSGLKRGTVQSCGCLQAESNRIKAAANVRHGYAKQSAAPHIRHTHRAWIALRQRCINPRTPAFGHYGGRGIDVCERWLQSFENFLADMGTRPDGLTLERLDNNKGYGPDNCKWGTRKEQSNNTRHNVKVEYNGVVLNLTQWAERTGIKFNTLKMRHTLGWSPERMLNDPLIPKGQRFKRARQWAERSSGGLLCPLSTN
jgi:hypothetical protein